MTISRPWLPADPFAHALTYAQPVMNLSSMTVRALLIFFSLTVSALAGDAVFVRNGEPIKITEASGEWQLVNGALEAKGPGSKLVAGQQIGPGDFSIRAELALEKMDRS